MKRIFAIAVLTLAASSFAPAQNATPSKLEQELRQVRQQLEDAFNRGDKATVERLIADDFFESGRVGRVTKADMLFMVPDPKDAGKFNKTETLLSDVQVRDYGDVASMSYFFGRVLQSGMESGGTLATDIYRRRNGQWQLAERPISPYGMRVIKTPPVAKIDPKLLDEYGGQYEWQPLNEKKIVISVVREGDKLFSSSPYIMLKEELLPENEIMFFTKGSETRTFFVRDTNGKVAKLFLRGSIIIKDGAEFKKIK